MHFATVFFDGDFTFFRPRQLDSPFLFTTPNSSPPTFNAWYTEELCRNWGQHKERILRPTRLDGKEKKTTTRCLIGHRDYRSILDYRYSARSQRLGDWPLNSWMPTTDRYVVEANT